MLLNQILDKQQTTATERVINQITNYNSTCMKHFTEETKAKLHKILLDKVKEEINEGNTIEFFDFECFHNGFGFFPSVTVGYSSEQVGDIETTGEVSVTHVSLVHIDFAEYRDREERVIKCYTEEQKQIEQYLLNNL